MAPALPPGAEAGVNLTSRGKLGSKRHISIGVRGVFLAIMVTGADRHEMAFESRLDAIPQRRS